MTIIGYTSYADWYEQQTRGCCGKQPNVLTSVLFGASMALPFFLSGLSRQETPEKPMNQTTPSTSTVTPTQEPPKEKTPEGKINDALKNTKYENWMNTDEKFKKEILAKYELLKGLDPTVLNKRLQNFARGYEFNQFQQTSQKEVFAELAETETMGASALKEFSLTENAPSDVALGYIEYFDTDNDGQILLKEMLVKELEVYYLEKGVKPEEIEGKIKNAIDNIKNGDTSSSEYNIYEMLCLKFETLEMNLAEGEKKGDEINGKLNSQDILEYLMYQANASQDSTFNSITAGEATMFEVGIQSGDANNIMEDTLEKLENSN